MNFYKIKKMAFVIVIFSLLCAGSIFAFAGDIHNDDSVMMAQKLDAPDAYLKYLAKDELEKKYLKTKITISEISWQGKEAYKKITEIQYLGERYPGVAEFFVFGVLNSGVIEKTKISVTFEAIQPALVALRRISPGEKLLSEDFILKEIDMSKGLARQNKGLILPPATALEEYEAVFTILEGGFPLRNGVKKIPNVKRGDVVKIKLIKGSIVLTTYGKVLDPAYINGPVKIVTQKTKKNLTGILKASQQVEVTL